MDRKNKVWLIVLIVLLILSVAGMVFSRNQLSAKEAEFESVSAQLTAAQEASAALESEVRITGHFRARCAVAGRCAGPRDDMPR